MLQKTLFGSLQIVDSARLRFWTQLVRTTSEFLFPLRKCTKPTVSYVSRLLLWLINLVHRLIHAWITVLASTHSMNKNIHPGRSGRLVLIARILPTQLNLETRFHLPHVGNRGFCRCLSSITTLSVFLSIHDVGTDVVRSMPHADANCVLF